MYSDSADNSNREMIRVEFGQRAKEKSPREARALIFED